MPGKPHDRLARSVLRDPGNAAAFFEVLLPEEIRRHLDLSKLKRIPESFIEMRLRETITDLLFEITFAGRPALLYLLLEHLSRPRPMAPYDLLVSTGRIWEEWRGRHPDSTTLPPVLPIVLFHGERPWSGAWRLRDLIAVPPEAEEVLAPWLPDQGFILIDLSMIPDDVLRRIAVSGAAWAALSLLLLKHSHDGTLLDGLVAWADLVRQVRDAPNGWAAVVRLVIYVLKATNIPDQDLARTLGAVLGPRAEEITMSTAEKLRLQGLAQGRTEGRTEGWTEGRMEARCEDLLRVLHSRFGSIGDDVRARVLAADLGTLDVWFDRALTAADLHSVFAHPSA